VQVVDLPKYIMQAFGGSSGTYNGVVEFFDAVDAVLDVDAFIKDNMGTAGGATIEYP
jgi:hypothetical protein